jgi:hypothetical protein
MIGLSRGEMNLMKFLNKDIQSNVVALDYDTHGTSNIRFGVFEQDKAKDGKLFVLPNAGHRLWTFKLDGVTYDDKRVVDAEEEDQIAFIDSGNSTIQLPMEVFKKVYH